MAKGKTISITVPTPVVEFYDKEAERMNMSRGGVIRSILIEDYNEKLKSKKEDIIEPTS